MSKCLFINKKLVGRWSGRREKHSRERWDRGGRKQPLATEEMKIRFDEFEVDLSSGELRRGETKIRVQEQPFKVLTILLERPREVVSREELKKRIWPAESFGDFDHAVNVAIAKLRMAMGDSAEDPKFVETIPRRGYRFMVEIEQPAEIQKTDLVSKPAKDLRGGYYLAIVVCLLAAGGAMAWWHTRQRDPTVVRLQETKISRITSDGNIEPVAISPDGRYIAFASTKDGKDSLRMRQLSGATSIEIASSTSPYQNLAFSPDGNTIFYRQADDTGETGFVYQVPAFGGASRRVAADVDSSLTVSPDGKRLAFVRHNPPLEISQLVLAMTDGSGERILAQTKYPEAFDFPAWSKDGRRIACVVRKALLGALADVVEIEVSSGTRGAPLLRDWRGIGQLGWTANPEGLVFLAKDETGSGRGQLFYLPYPNGVIGKITNGVEIYEGLSVSNDSRHLATVLEERNSTIWIASGGDAGRMKEITTGPGRSDGVVGLSWTHDGRIIFSSRASGDGELWVADPKDGTSQQMTANSGQDFCPSVMPDGSILFSSTRATGKMRIWHMNGDGSNPQQLTSGSDDLDAVSTPDGRWVLYQSSAGGQSSVWKIPIGGGKPERLSSDLSGGPAISPDGKTLAYFEALRDGFKGVVEPMDHSSPRRIFPLSFAGLPPNNTLAWSEDGKSVQFVKTREKVSNLWSQPIAGGPAKQLTHFSSGQIFAFAWSPDFKELALARGDVTRDVVVIEDLR
jgi:Tol biopolymer transport system component/DNA-binding winged helix-turn-helix (wHTH) protein